METATEQVDTNSNTAVSTAGKAVATSAIVVAGVLAIGVVRRFRNRKALTIEHTEVTD
jgi:hypothetical protein